MPINIIDHSKTKKGERGTEVDHLCGDDWELPSQIDALEYWLINNQSTLTCGSYVADVGYSPRPGACGGGGAVTLKAMKIMVAIGMELFLSEYPEFVDEPSTVG